jgi:hypothetical protein
MDDTTYKIEQRRFLRGRQTLTIEGDKLKAEYRRGLSLHEYRWDLRGFLPEPTRIRQTPAAKIVMLTLCVVLGLTLTVTGIIGATTARGEVLAGVAVLGVLLLTFGIAGWIPTAKELVNVIVFEGPGGRAILWPNLPSKEQFDQFVAVLTARIRNTRGCEQTILRRLRQADIIDDWQYDQAVELFHQNSDLSNNW